MRVLIAIPVYNERRYVSGVLDKVRRYHDQILVVDDGSTDGTSEILRSRPDVQVIRHATNQGYGQSLIDAFAFADAHGYDWVITMDCDEQHEPEMIPEFMRQIETDRWDIVSGSRYMQERADNDSPPGERRAVNSFITGLLNDLLHLNLTDAFCGFKAHRTSAMARLGIDQTGYAFPLQFWPRAVAAGLRITEIPVRLIYNDPTRHFGGPLDDVLNRLQHYLSVLRAEIARMPAEEACEPAACSGCCG